MPSQTKATREKQKKYFEALLNERKTILLNKGLTEKTLTKDKFYEHLKAKHKSVVKAISAIDARILQNENLKNRVKVEKVPSTKEAHAKKQEQQPQKPKKEKKEKVEKKEG